MAHFVVSRPLPQDKCDELLDWCRQQAFRLYPFRGKFLVRSPKVEFRKDASVGTYRWGQEISAQAWGEMLFPPVLQELVEAIGDPEINHIIVISYTDGARHHIPWHSDKQEGVPGAGAKDIRAGTNIYNMVVCDRPRIFELAPADDLERPLFSRELTHGELLTLTAEGNLRLKHRVPKQPGWAGHRYSVVLRSVKVAAEVKRRRLS